MTEHNLLLKCIDNTDRPNLILNKVYIGQLNTKYCGDERYTFEVFPREHFFTRRFEVIEQTKLNRILYL